ncbi:hypothetical protein D3C85_1052380 [compost metagenome]
MNDRMEYVTSTTKASEVIVSATEGRLRNALKYGGETAESLSCGECSTLALCGLAINIMRARDIKISGATLESLKAYGVQADRGAEVCPGAMVDEVIKRNNNDDFWVLKADELNYSSDEIKNAQAVARAAEDVAQIINKKIVI